MTEKLVHIRPVSLVALSALLFLLAAGVGSSWEYSEFSFDVQGRMAMMASAGKWNPYLEVQGVYYGDESTFRSTSFTAGSYFRAAPWLKVGAFYSLQSGVRHLDDWVVDAGPPADHSWNDVTDRVENLIYLDATPRIRFSDKPANPWVAPLKLRYYYNFFNNEQTLLIRPGITYVLMEDRVPLVNFTLNYSLYFALNFGSAPVYSHGPYFTVLGHVNDWIKLEGRVQYQMKTYKKYDSGYWTLHSNHLAVWLGVIFTPEFGITPVKRGSL